MENYIFWSFMLIAFLLLVLLRKVSATISGPRLKAVPPPITPSAEDALERSALEPTSQSHSAKDAQTVSTDTEWFYVSGGSRHGPLSQAALVELIRSDAVPADTIVWHHEMKEWKPAKETELKKFLPLEQTNDETPPPILSSAVNNTLAWLMALVPFAAGFFLTGTSFEAAIPVGVVGSLVCIVLAIIDSTMVRKAAQKWSGYESVWMLLGYGLTPVYLYKRARALKHSLGYFWLSIVAVVSSILIAQPNLLSHSTYWGFGLPECNNAYAAGKVKEIFVQMPLAASAGLYALEVTDAAELSSDKLKRACHATLRTNKGTRLPVSFTMERATEQASEFYVRLLIDDPTDLLRITPQSQ